MTTFLWVLAAIGAVGLGLILAFALSRAGGGAQPLGLREESARSRWARDNETRLNPAAFLVFGLVIAVVAGLAIALELS